MNIQAICHISVLSVQEVPEIITVFNYQVRSVA
jgi:hypothetical protein